MYPETGRLKVDFTCTLTKRPVVPTTKSYGQLSPQGLLTGNPRSWAFAMKTDSAHSPRCFLFSIVSGLRDFTLGGGECLLKVCHSEPSGAEGEDERGIRFPISIACFRKENAAIRKKFANAALSFYWNRPTMPKARIFGGKIEAASRNGRGQIRSYCTIVLMIQFKLWK